MSLALVRTYDVFKDKSTGWTSDDLLARYWDAAEAHASRAFRPEDGMRLGVRLEDHCMAGTEALTATVAMYFDWCAERNINPDERGVFWVILKRRIDWELGEVYKKAQKRVALRLAELDDGEREPHPELVATQLSRYRPPSALHRQVTDRLAILPTRDKLSIALRYFEEMGYDKIATLMGCTKTVASTHVFRVCTDITREARNLVVSDPHPPDHTRKVTPFVPNEELIEWLRDNYGTEDLHAYLGYVTIHYYADVSYLIDFLDRAHGKRLQFGARGASLISDEQWADIDASIFAGETKRSIAARLGLDEQYLVLMVARSEGKRPA